MLGTIIITAMIFTALGFIWGRFNSKGKKGKTFRGSTNPDQMTDDEYIWYLEREIKVMHFKYEAFLDSYCTKFPTVDSKSFLRIMEQTFYAISDCLTQYDRGESAEHTLYHLKYYLKKLFGPVVRDYEEMKDSGEAMAIEAMYEGAVKSFREAMPRVRKISPVFSE
jgi:hypothetical protein